MKHAPSAYDGTRNDSASQISIARNDKEIADEITSNESLTQIGIDRNDNVSQITDASSQTATVKEKKDIFWDLPMGTTEIWRELRSRVINEHHDVLAKEIRRTMKNLRVSRGKAKSIVFAKWLPFFQKKIYKAYFDKVRFHRELKKDSLHNKIMNLKRKIGLEDDNEDDDEDLRQAIKRKKYAIQKATGLREEDILPVDSSSDEDSGDEDDEEDTENELDEDSEDDGDETESVLDSEDNIEEEPGSGSEVDDEGDSDAENSEVESEVASEVSTNVPKTNKQGKIQRKREFEKKTKQAKKELDAYKLKHGY